LKQIVAATQDIEVAGEAKDGRETLDKISKENYDVVLLDISMPGISGLDVLKQLRSQKPLLRVLMLSIYPEEQYAIRTLKAGASFGLMGMRERANFCGGEIEIIGSQDKGTTVIARIPLNKEEPR